MLHLLIDVNPFTVLLMKQNPKLNLLNLQCKSQATVHLLSVLNVVLCPYVSKVFHKLSEMSLE
jgi:hypothetical protein